MNLQEKINVMQAALDGKVIEFADIGLNNWASAGKDSSKISWNFVRFEYRIAQTKDYIDWSHVSDEYKWMARDEDGVVYLYADKPDKYPDYWYGESGEVTGAEQFKSFKQGNVPWEESLIERHDQHTTIKFYTDRITIEA